MNPCHRQLYLLNAEVNLVAGANTAGSVVVQYWPVVGFKSAPPDQHTPLVMRTGGSQIPVAAQSMVSWDGAAPVPWPMYYDDERTTWWVDNVAYPSFDALRRKLLEGP